MNGEDDMRLPKGKTCSDCRFYQSCVDFFGCEPTNEGCDWSPSSFVEKCDATPPAAGSGDAREA